MQTPQTPSLDSRIKNRNTRYAARPGFSMLELVAVLVILGLLMAGAAVAVPKQIAKARIRITKTSMTTIKTSINTYMVDHNGDAPTYISDLIPGFIEEGSELDAWDRAFYYNPTPGAAHAFDLISAGADHEFQTDDDINLWTMKVSSSD